jgi:hypothetical protein
MLTNRQREFFRAYLRGCTDQQVQGVYDKEKRAGREEEMELCQMEARWRGIFLELEPKDDVND